MAAAAAKNSFAIEPPSKKPRLESDDCLETAPGGLPLEVWQLVIAWIGEWNVPSKLALRATCRTLRSAVDEFTETLRVFLNGTIKYDSLLPYLVYLRNLKQLYIYHARVTSLLDFMFLITPLAELLERCTGLHKVVVGDADQGTFLPVLAHAINAAGRRCGRLSLQILKCDLVSSPEVASGLAMLSLALHSSCPNLARLSIESRYQEDPVDVSGFLKMLLPLPSLRTLELREVSMQNISDWAAVFFTSHPIEHISMTETLDGTGPTDIEEAVAAGCFATGRLRTVNFDGRLSEGLPAILADNPLVDTIQFSSDLTLTRRLVEAIGRCTALREFAMRRYAGISSDGYTGINDLLRALLPLPSLRRLWLPPGDYDGEGAEIFAIDWSTFASATLGELSCAVTASAILSALAGLHRCPQLQRVTLHVFDPQAAEWSSIAAALIALTAAVGSLSSVQVALDGSDLLLSGDVSSLDSCRSMFEIAQNELRAQGRRAVVFSRGPRNARDYIGLYVVPQ